MASFFRKKKSPCISPLAQLSPLFWVVSSSYEQLESIWIWKHHTREWFSSLSFHTVFITFYNIGMLASTLLVITSVSFLSDETLVFHIIIIWVSRWLCLNHRFSNSSSYCYFFIVLGEERQLQMKKSLYICILFYKFVHVSIQRYQVICHGIHMNFLLTMYTV